MKHTRQKEILADNVYVDRPDILPALMLLITTSGGAFSRKCSECGRPLPDDWKGPECFFCWMGIPRSAASTTANGDKKLCLLEEEIRNQY